ncbi:hypothetical protein [Ramlibacter sp.]|uniref:hypothetical protein n=1 Tax=Ramlibacter sp. TaxID=1917967 RepID=UPI002603FE8C|nr:hypothetical protein [Ramlibacter sp.]MDB5956746.1 hypothetical protein [Ramlibacter sp.]
MKSLWQSFCDGFVGAFVLTGAIVRAVGRGSWIFVKALALALWNFTEPFRTYGDPPRRRPARKSLAAPARAALAAATAVAE